jgi:hypothetical protein
VAGGTVTLCSDTVQSNAAQGGTAALLGATGQGYGGGLYLAAKANKVYLDSFTVNDTINNTANVDPNIDGSYTLQNC